MLALEGTPPIQRADGLKCAFGFLAAVTVSITLASAIEYNQTWMASSGDTPPEACPAWENFAGSPDIQDDVLPLVTTACSDQRYYLQTPLTIPQQFVLESSLQIRSSLSCDPCLDTRRVGFIGVTTEPFVGTLLLIGVDEIILMTSVGCDGTFERASVETDDGLHTYRIEIDSDDNVSVFYDDTLTLQGALYTSSADHGSVRRVIWGDVSRYAHGDVDWAMVRHNAHPEGCDRDNDGSRVELDCNDLDSCTYPGAPEICDDIDNNCDGIADEGALIPPSLVSGLTAASDKTTFEWNKCGNSWYDVVRGNLVALRDTGGSFSTSIDSCLDDDSLDNSTSDLDIPLTEQGYYYLTRPNASCGIGTYDSGGEAQVTPRDASISMSPLACP